MPKPQHVDDKLYVIIVLLWFFFSDGPSRTEVVVVVFVLSLWIFVGVTCAPQDCTILICCTLQTKGNHIIFKSSRLLSCGTLRVYDVLAWATNDIIVRYCGCLCVLGIVTVGFLSLHWTFAGTYKRGKIARKRPLGLQERKLVTISWHTEICFEWACTDVKEEAAFWAHSGLSFVERSNTQHAKNKTKTVIIKAVHGACLRTNKLTN